MTVYADVVFFTNFLFDLEILMILCRLFSKKPSVLRLFLSACIGGVQGIFVFIPYFRILCTPPASLLLPILMIVIVFRKSSFNMYKKAYFTFLGISFVFSGIITFFKIPSYLGILMPLPVYAMTFLLKKTASEKRYSTAFFYGDKSCVLDGFYDSGNKVFCMGAPVIFGDRTVFEALFGKGFCIDAINEWVSACDVRVVPYSALGKSGAIIGVRLDRVIVDKKNYDNVILGYFSDKLEESLILNGIMI